MSSDSDDDAGAPIQVTNEFMMPFAQSAYASLHFGLLTLGLQLCLCIYGYSVYRVTTAELKRYRRPYIIVSFALVAFSMLSTVTDGVLLANMLVNGQRDFLQFVGENSPWYSVVGTVAVVLINFCGDGLLIWRCYIVWTGQPWVVVAPGLAYFASFALAIVTTIAGEGNNLDPTTFGAAWISLSVFVNFYVTAMISWRLLKERKRLAAVLSPDHLVKYVGASAILIESALPFTIFGVIAAVFYANPLLGIKSGSTTVVAIWFCLAALCPQLIIFRVSTGTAYSRNDLDNNRDSELASRPLEFAAYNKVPQREESVTDI